MRPPIRTIVLAIASATALVSTRALHAQPATQTDARWYAWLGCWAPDTAAPATRAMAQSITCIVPVAQSRAVDALTIVRGKVTTRDRLDAGRPHAIDGQGCRGTEVVNWSAAGHRVFLRADYTCAGGTPGASATIFALSPGGDFLRIERVRSGSGAVVSVDRLRETDLPAVVSAEAVRAIESQQRAITTARAGAAVPITADEIIDAVRTLDGEVVRSWLVASEQPFAFDGQQIAALTNAGVPAAVLQVVSAGATPIQYTPLAPRNADVYANDPVYTQQTYPQMTTMRRCPPDGCYTSDQYSTYNGYNDYSGYSYQPLPRVIYPYAYAPYYYPAPVIVRRGVNQGVNRGTSVNRGGNRGDGRNVGRGVGRTGERYQPPARPAQPKPAAPVGRRR